MYVIRRNEDGKFVARPGSEHSYTANIMKARQFNTKGEAEKDCCGNENVASLASLLQQGEAG